jgi:hypothetical protein
MVIEKPAPAQNANIFPCPWLRRLGSGHNLLSVMDVCVDAAKLRDRSAMAAEQSPRSPRPEAFPLSTAILPLNGMPQTMAREPYSREFRSISCYARKMTLMGGSLDPWHATCETLARRADQRAVRQAPPPTDAWEAWCREMERRGEYPSHIYFPSDESAIVFMGPGGSAFSYETEEQTAWREASNRMKRAGDLWQKHGDSVADSWGRWCTSKAVNQAGGRINTNHSDI